LETVVRPLIPLAPTAGLLQLDPVRVAQALGAALLGALAASAYPAWRAGNLPPALATRSE
jgi:ABC-type lipoprotein release transport system permease subunit